MVVSAALLPVIGRERPRIDGLILGAGAAALVLIKLTFFVGVVPAIILLLLLRRDWITLVTALSVGLLVAVSVVFWAGFDYWLAYLRDLLVVASSDGRSQPSESYGATAASPAYLGASLLALAAVVILRRSGARMEGLALLLLYPGFVLVAWQNWGNEPTWLWLLGLLLMALRPTIADLGGFLKGRAMLTIVAAMALAENAVTSHAGVPPFAETRAYVPKVLAAWDVARGLCQTRPELITDACVFVQGKVASDG